MPESISRSLRHGLLTGVIALLFTGPALADRGPPAQVASQDGHWGEFEPLSQGFVGRRRVPPNFELPPEQRRTAGTQVQTRLQERPGAHGRERAAQARGGAGSFETADIPDWARALLGQQEFARPSPRVTGRDARSAWLMTDAPGLYSVPLDDIAAQAGMSSTLLRARARSGRLNLLNDGEPVSWRYDADADSLQFAAEAYETFYAEGNAYELTADIYSPGPDPQRMTETRPSQGGISRGAGNGRSQAVNAAVAGQATPFRDTVRFEEETDMLFVPWVAAQEPDADYWFWDWLFAGHKDSIDLTLDLPKPAANGVAEIRVELRGRTKLNPGNEHQVYAELNGQRLGSVAWDGFEVAVLVAQFDQGLLNPNGENSLRLGNVYSEGQRSGQYLNAIEVDYRRMPVAADGQLWLRGVEGGAQTVTGFSSSDVFVIESPARGAKLRGDARAYRDGTGWAVDFAADAGADFLVVESSGLRVPVIHGEASEDLRNRRNGAEYLVIAPRELSGTAEAFVEYRSASFGAVKIAWLDDIYKDFAAGREDPFAISRFMHTVMNDWRHAPSMVLLVGKGSLDHKDRMGYGDSFVPVVMTSNPWSLAPSDARLLGFDEGITPFAYGRLAIMNDQEGLAYVEKLRGHETRVRTGERGAVITADNPDSAGNFHAHSLEKTLRLFDLGFDVAWQFFHPDHQVRAAFVESETWNRATYMSYDGHGSVQQIGNHGERFLTVPDAEALTNENLPVFTAMTCASGDDSLPATRSLASALVLNRDGGAIASLAPTGLSLSADAHALGMAFVEQLFAGNQTVGAAVSSAKRSENGRINGFMSPMYAVLGDPAARAQ